MARFEVFRDEAGEHRFRLVADNGEVVCQSEAYASASGAERAIGDLEEILSDAPLEVRVED